LILPPETATTCAARWFAKIAGDDVDADGYFLYEDGHSETENEDSEPDAVAFQIRVISAEERVESEGRFWSALSVQDRVDLVMRFSDLHLALVALVSDDAAERLRVAAGLTPAQAAIGREQMTRAVAAVRAGL
jgi:hypothetical protein